MSVLLLQCPSLPPSYLLSSALSSPPPSSYSPLVVGLMVLERWKSTRVKLVVKRRRKLPWRFSLAMGDSNFRVYSNCELSNFECSE